MLKRARKPGVLYGCGEAGHKGAAHPLLPVDSSAIDSGGDCPYPSPILLPKKTKFLRVSADMGAFCALDTEGGLWVWGNERWGFPPSPTRVVENGVTDCSSGGSFVVYVVHEHQVMTMGKTTWEEGPLPGWKEDENDILHIEACGGTVAVVGKDGALYTIGSGVTNGIGKDTKKMRQIKDIPPMMLVALGSLHAASISMKGELFVWGDGVQGTLAMGRRVKFLPNPTLVPSWADRKVQWVGCTRGQPGPKRLGKKSGQEGPRLHVIDEDRRLWIAGTTHKGMGADHLSKAFMPKKDLLSLYLVGSRAQDVEARKVVTGAAEDISTDPALAAQRMGMEDMSSYGKEGQTGYLSDVRLMTTSAAHIHSVALSEDGRLFAWGCGSDGRTGLRAFMRGPGGSKRAMKCYVSTPSQIESLEGQCVEYVEAGRYWTLMIVS